MKVFLGGVLVMSNGECVCSNPSIEVSFTRYRCCPVCGGDVRQAVMAKLFPKNAEQRDTTLRNLHLIADFDSELLGFELGRRLLLRAASD